MGFKKVFFAIFLTVFFIACNFTEEIHLNKDGSGKMNIGFDGSEMLQMIPASDSLSTKEVIDSTLVFKDFLREKKDSIAQLPIEEQEKLKKLEPFSIHMVVDEPNGVMNFDMFSDFKNVSDVNDAFNAFQNASTIGPSAGDASMPKKSSDGATQVSYSFNGNKFVRETEIKDMELFKKSLDSLQSAEMFLGGSTYTFKYHFPKRVKSTNVEKATFSMDGKTMIYEVNFLDMLKDPESIKIEVELEK
ncbi:hypothetical protein [Maribacter cobaltidurans]|uniref:Uncharacterized protein n=1 Tax=Maribacter cobaltidurans TaxID=1178778 RepID=A0A223V6T8_9FLAO|nr:hypothetical protein [Maribacter cobaltidurans]ASV31012.1 hypothetical protein CJ263_12745 [Maribacter cobaltidurans]GGD73150.1 hypothetical protein GCM10011412_08550 [Maribacter cobaltidurans]